MGDAAQNDLDSDPCDPNKTAAVSRLRHRSERPDTDLSRNLFSQTDFQITHRRQITGEGTDNLSSDNQLGRLCWNICFGARGAAAAACDNGWFIFRRNISEITVKLLVSPHTDAKPGHQRWHVSPIYDPIVQSVKYIFFFLLYLEVLFVFIKMIKSSPSPVIHVTCILCVHGLQSFLLLHKFRLQPIQLAFIAGVPNLWS